MKTPLRHFSLVAILAFCQWSHGLLHSADIPEIPKNPGGAVISKPPTEDPEDEDGECKNDEEEEDETTESGSLFQPVGSGRCQSSDPRNCAYTGSRPPGERCLIGPCDLNGCINYTLSFGKMPFLGGFGNGSVQLLKVKPSPDLFDPSALTYHSAIGSWIRLDELDSSGVRRFHFLDKLSNHTEFYFAAGSQEGLPVNPHEKSKMRGRLVASNGVIVSNVAGNNAKFLELVFPKGSILRYDLQSGDPVSFKNTTGRHVVFAEIPEAIRTRVVRDGNTLQQVKSVEGLLDIVRLANERGFELRRYLPSQIGIRGPDGRYEKSGVPVSVIRFENPTTGTGRYEAMDITEIIGTREKKLHYRYLESLGDWALEKGNGASKEEKALISESNGNRVFERRLYDNGSNLVSRNRFTEWTSPWGEVVRTEEVNDFGGANLTKRYAYYTTKGQPGYGKLREVTYEDNSWKRYYYDELGRTIRTESPYLDSGIRTAEFSYAPVDSRDHATPLDTRVRTTAVKLNGIVVSRHWNAYVTDSATGEVQEISEQAASQGSSFGDPANQRSTVTYYAPGSGLFLAGRVKSRENSQGSLTSYTYVQNNANAQAFFVVTETQGIMASPDGIIGKTQRIISTKDAQGREVKNETQVLVAAGSFATLSVSEIGYSVEGVATIWKRNGKTIHELTYENRQVIWEKDAEGVEKSIAYDELDRISRVTEKGVAGRPDKIMAYARELGGVDCDCDSDMITTISAGELSLSSRVKKDKAGRITEETNTAGFVTSYAYANGGRITTTVRPNTATETRENYPDGRLKSITGTGVLAQYYTYGVNADGSQWTRVHQASPNGPRWSYSVSDFRGRTVRSERPAFGGSVAASLSFYDEKGRLIRTEERIEGGTAPTSTGNPLLATTRFYYNALDEVIKTEITRGDITNVSENDQSYVIANGIVYQDSWNKSDGIIISRSRTLAGIPANPMMSAESWSVGVPESNKADFSWQAASTAAHSYVTFDRATQTRVSTTKLPTSIQSAIETTVGGLRVSSVSASHGGTTLYRYDALGRMTGIKQPRHTNYSTTEYNAQGQVIASADAAGYRTVYAYYSNGVVGAGQLRQVTNALEGTVFHQYDIQGREVYTWGSATYPVAQGYDAYGQRNLLRTYRDISTDFTIGHFPLNAQGDTTIWNYDPVTGVLLQKLYADGKGPRYDYYADGQLRTRNWARKDASGNPLTTFYAYTPQGQLTKVVYSDATPSVEYSYNALGQVTQIVDGAGTRNYDYDPDRRIPIGEHFHGIVNGQLAFSYDNDGRVTKTTLSLPDGYTNASQFLYDGYGRLNKIDRVQPDTGEIKESHFYTRYSGSNLISQQKGSWFGQAASAWILAENTYESNREVLISKQNKSSSGVVVSQYDYTVDPLGQRSARAQSGSAFAQDSTDNFQYNRRGEVTGSFNNKIDAFNSSYGYDPIGNRVTSAEGIEVKIYTSNSLNQYAQIRKNSVNSSPTYDLDGNMISDGTGMSYVWDAENRLIQVMLPNGERVHYTYDSNCRRVKREHIAGVVREVTTYLYDGWNVIYEASATQSGDSQLVASGSKLYTWGLDLSGSLQGAGGVGGLLSVVDLGKGLTGGLFYCYDANGNVSELLDVAGGIQAHYEYNAYGKVVMSSGEHVLKNSYQFSTKPWDGSVGLSYYGYRFYDSNNGRWINRDRIEEEGGVFLYGYVNNNSINSIDLLGNQVFFSVIGYQKAEPEWVSTRYTMVRALGLTNSDFKAINVRIQAIRGTIYYKLTYDVSGVSLYWYTDTPPYGLDKIKSHEEGHVAIAKRNAQGLHDGFGINGAEGCKKYVSCMSLKITTASVYWHLNHGIENGEYEIATYPDEHDTGYVKKDVAIAKAKLKMYEEIIKKGLEECAKSGKKRP